MIQRYLIYLAIAVVAGLIGAFISNQYSNSAIAELKAEIASERKISQDVVKEYQTQIDSQVVIIKKAEERGFLYKKEIANIIKNREKFNRIDSSYRVILSPDSLVEELRKIYN